MLLKCPHCSRAGEHVRSDFFGDWVVCSVCELPFAWRDARAGNGSKPSHGNGQSDDPGTNERAALQETVSRTRNER
jgi:hypothetical protein